VGIENLSSISKTHPTTSRDRLVIHKYRTIRNKSGRRTSGNGESFIHLKNSSDDLCPVKKFHNNKIILTYFESRRMSIPIPGQCHVSVNQSGHRLIIAAHLYGQACGFSPQKTGVGLKTELSWGQNESELGSS